MNNQTASGLEKEKMIFKNTYHNPIKANQFHPYFDFYTKSSAKFLKLRYFKQSHIHHNAIRSVCNRGIGFCENK